MQQHQHPSETRFAVSDDLPQLAGDVMLSRGHITERQTENCLPAARKSASFCGG